MAGLEKIWVLSYELTNTYIIPVRCFSCGKVVGDNGTSISDHLHTEMSEGDSMERLGLVRYSCRPDGHNSYDVDWIEKLLLYNANNRSAVKQAERREPCKPLETKEN